MDTLLRDPSLLDGFEAWPAWVAAVTTLAGAVLAMLGSGWWGR